RRLRRLPEACGELEQNATELVRFSQRQNAFFELIDRFKGPFALFVGELLPGFDGELKICGRSLCPTLRGFCRTRSIKSRIDFHGIEKPRIELQLICSG